MSHEIEARELARMSDPSTSHAAAARVGEFAGSFCDRIAEALKLGPATFEELSVRTGLRQDQVWRRLPDLQKAGIAWPTEHEREGSSGRFQRVWKLCEARS